MKKLLSFFLLCSLLASLYNCSPKTSKKLAATSAEDKKPEMIAASPQAAPVPNDEVERPAPATRATPVSFQEMGVDQKLTMFQDMAPVRLEMGKKLYTTHCNKCHDYYVPSSRGPAAWVQVMDEMAPKAKLSTEQHIMVAGYLVANAQK